MRMNLKRICEELAKKCKAGSSSDYQDLWLTINNLLRNFETELRQIIYQIEREPAHEGFPPSYRYMEGWLDGVSFALKKFKEILGEEVSEG